ncbi:hypothetical protein TMatcc_007654 [Talaromyces marneffei ATCC 18224]|nr:uncharacterized protein EYB26_004591 [Talaromyces marneffei]KAE8552947.1 hypothetical protein EYB25_004326 [Talaromyces marneffei]QGA16921.1 hypothetical protein EYB26_004591 [Talaromyces marneffei]
MSSPTTTYQNGPMQGSQSSTSSTADSVHSRSTAPTEHSRRITITEKEDESFAAPFFTEDPRNSNSTYASTVPSFEDFPKQAEEEKEPRYEVVTDRQETFASSAIPSNSATFADLFPSGRRLFIHHDDSTLDGNMNLRVDTLLNRRDRTRQQEVTLFHLRMHDLHSRNFSFRRYCRDSGREVCHSRRLTQMSHSQRPNLRRSWSTALNGLRPGSGSSDKNSANGFLKLNNGSKHSHHQSLPKSSPLQDLMHDEPTSSWPAEEKLSNTMLLEFCNYAHVELSRVGVTPSKRYEFEYWSTRYQWRREFRREGDLNEVSYHLVNLESSRTVAYIVPEILTPMELMEEEEKGGWVPKCSMWISDSSVYERMPDVADVIVATGIMVLVDDSIRRRWHNKRQVRLNMGHRRASSFLQNIHLDSLGPKRLIDEIFHRRGSA